VSPAGASVRAAAARAVDAVIHHGRSLDAALAVDELPPRDAALARNLAFGTIRHHLRLEARVATLLSKPLRKRDRIISALLEVGLFQFEETRVPDHAAVSATVDATRLLGRPKLSGLVNAVLRRARREPWTPADRAAKTLHPDWLLEQLKVDWPDDWEAVVNANNARAPMWLRVNARRTSVDAYRRLLAAADIEADRYAATPDALRLKEPVAVATLPGFDEGVVSVQDGGAQFAGDWLASLDGRRFLDACSAPGGKAAHWLERSEGTPDLTCIDVDAERAESIRTLMSRLGLTATVKTADAADLSSFFDGRPFDAILLDAPCSASGVIRRHPDIRLLRRADDIPRLAALQRSILEALWPALRPGGHLLYVTCSVLRAENELNVAAFLERTPDASENEVLHNNNARDVMRRLACGYQILPGTDGMDGFYFACLSKADD